MPVHWRKREKEVGRRESMIRGRRLRIFIADFLL
jgi:hypothetical protein